MCVVYELGFLFVVVLEEIRLGKKKKDGKKIMLLKNILNFNNKYEEFGDFERDDWLVIYWGKNF